MQSLVFYDPGHFHAALTLRAANPRVDPVVHVHAPAGPELDAFVDLVRSFNHRTEAPTQLDLRVHEGGDGLEALIDEQGGAAVVLAGRNDRKLAVVRQLHEAGFPCLVDKPWITTSAGLDDLERVTAGPPLVMDLMTERYDAVARLRRRVVATEPVFGGFVDDGEPALDIGSRHHLYKIVNGTPLRRPTWYYDVAVQGDGLVDIQAHMTDQAQWLIDPDDACDFEGAIIIDGAERWTTAVPLDLFAESTGAPAFPQRLAGEVVDGELRLACNGRIDYRLGGVRVRQRAEWGRREAVGGGDEHRSLVRGTGASVVVRQGAETGHRAQIHLRADGAPELEGRLGAALAEWRGEFPGLHAAPSDIGHELLLPASLRTPHEAHFPMVLDAYLDRLEDGGWDAAWARRQRARYTLLARARDLAGDLAGDLA